MPYMGERHHAIVTKNDDPDKLGRIMVKCAAITGDADTELPMWVQPLFDWGWFYIPDIDEQVEIEVVTDSDVDESRGQALIADAEVRWLGKRYYSPQGATPLKVPPDFTSQYGKQRGFATPFGHVLLFDDKTPAIYLTFAKAQVKSGEQPKPADCTQVLIDADGSVKITTLEKDFVHLKPDGHEIEVSLEGAKHVLTIGPNKLELKLDSGASIKLEGKDANAKATLGDGAVKVTIADNFKTWYDSQVKVWMQTHVHPDGMGGTGPSPNPPPTWDTTMESTKLKIPNG